MTSFIIQYELLFSISWVVLYLIFPTWALPISVAGRASVFFVLITYFAISAVIMNRWFNALDVDKPLIVWIKGLGMIFSEHRWLVFICSISVVLHIYPIFFPILILGDETIHLQNGLWIYEHINVHLHPFFQIAFWVIIGLLVFFRKKLTMDSLDRLSNRLVNGNALKYSLVLLVVFLVFYFLLLRNITHYPSLIRYPPLAKFLYFGAFSAFGINHIFPRIVQLIFYLLSAVYLYRTINLFYEKETAFLGAALYLFLPIPFAYAHLGELASGTIFSIVITSFYFMRFVKDGDERDLIIATYLIGIGCMYKKLNLLMFIICFTFLVLYKTKKHDSSLLKHFKVLTISLVPIIPWLILTKYFSWRNYSFRYDNVSSLDKKIIPYLSLISSNVSDIVFVLIALSVLYICFFKRNILTVFFGIIFCTYAFFIISDMGSLSPRFSMALYPTMIVFLSLFISRIIQIFKWRHAFKFCTILITSYLIIISTVSPLNDRFLSVTKMKLMYFPCEEAMKWVKDNVNNNEKVLTVRIQSSLFYQKKFEIDRKRILDLRYSFKEIYTPEKLLAYYKEQDLSYIMFPHNPAYVKGDIRAGILDYLKNNPDDEFIEVAKFSRGDKFIYIYKLASQGAIL